MYTAGMGVEPEQVLPKQGLTPARSPATLVVGHQAFRNKKSGAQQADQ